MAVIHVVIPCYNVEEYLEQAVNSVLNQPSKEIDIVLVDDGSPDGSPQICDRLAEIEKRVHVVHQENGGLCAARNSGIEYVLRNLYTEGEREFIAFLDADDAWCPDVISEREIQHLLTDWDEDVVGFSGVYSNSQMDRFSAVIPNENVSGAVGETLIWRAQNVHLGAKLFSIDLITEWNLRFQHKQLYTEDKIFLLQSFYLAEKARLVDRPLYVYRKNKNGIMSQIMKLSATRHYLPIVDGWRKCDDFLNALEPRTGRHSVSGYILAAGYLVEMVAEHFKKWGNRKEIFEIFQNHPHFDTTYNMEEKYFTARAYRRNRLLFEYPRLFELKYRMLGIVEWIAWKLLYIPLVNHIREKKKYPFTEIPD